MSDAIEPGDLVMIVRGMPCCGYLGNWHLGAPHTVAALRITPPGYTCAQCDAPAPSQVAQVSEGDCVPLTMLKRFPPRSALREILDDLALTA